MNDLMITSDFCSREDRMSSIWLKKDPLYRLIKYLRNLIKKKGSSKDNAPKTETQLLMNLKILKNQLEEFREMSERFIRAIPLAVELPEHDCKTGPEHGCAVCAKYGYVRE